MPGRRRDPRRPHRRRGRGRRPIDEPARRTIDADGLVACPGFVDPHTHYDAQLFWDPPRRRRTCTASRPSSAATAASRSRRCTTATPTTSRRMMAKVEGMPLAALEQGVAWTGRRFGEYLDALEGRIARQRRVPRRALRAAPLRDGRRGHRQRGHATSELDADARRAARRRSTPAGSASRPRCRTRTPTATGSRSPAAWRDRDEVLALCEDDRRATRARRSRASSTAASTGSPTTRSSCSPQMSVAGRPPAQLERAHRRLARARARRRASSRPSTAPRALGGRVVALTMPVHRADEHELPQLLRARSSCPGWGDVMNLPVPERIEQLARSRRPAA